MQHAIDFLSKSDKNFADIITQYGVPNIVERPPGYETLCKIILEQQVSLESAKACFDRLKALVGTFSPENILQCSEADFRMCGLSRQKAKYITALADAIVTGEIDLESFANKSAGEIRSELIKIKGVGNWTIDVYLMFSLKSPDVIPLGDIGIVITIKELWQLETNDQILKLSESWAPFRTTAAFFLWHYYLKKRNRVIHP